MGGRLSAAELIDHPRPPRSTINSSTLKDRDVFLTGVEIILASAATLGHGQCVSNQTVARVDEPDHVLGESAAMYSCASSDISWVSPARAADSRGKRHGLGEMAIGGHADGRRR